MNLLFSDSCISFKGEINNKFGYEIVKKVIKSYGKYLSPEEIK